MKCLILNFTNAGVFRFPERSKDRAVDIDGAHERSTFPKMPVKHGELSHKFISNVLHVLMGERPVPSLRKTLLRPVTGIVEMAKKARYKVVSIFDEKGMPIFEKMTIRKTKWGKNDQGKIITDSWNTASHNIRLAGKEQPVIGAVLSWRRMHDYLGDELNEEIRSIIKELFGESYFTGKFEAVIDLLYQRRKEPKVKSFAEKCLKANKTPIYTLLMEGRTDGQYFHTDSGYGDSKILNRCTVTRGVEDIAKISGKIYVRVSDADIEKLRQGPGVATILEGGIVTIDDVDEWSENLVLGTKVPAE